MDTNFSEGETDLTRSVRSTVPAPVKDGLRVTPLREFFDELGLTRALEGHARLKLLPEEVLWEMVEAGQAEEVVEWGRQRHEEIGLEESNPFLYGWRGDPGRTRELGGSWKRAVDAIAAVKGQNVRSIPKVLCMGGNGSSKSEFAAWWAVQQMVSRKDFRVAVLCPSEKQAREVMMARLWRYFPPEWKPAATGKLKSGVTGNISYSEKMGFTENMFIFPNGSRCTFYFYEDGDPKALEGIEIDAAIADEEVPLNWLEAVEFRLVRRSGVLLTMFTPISGYTPTVAWFKGELGKVLEWREAELLPVWGKVLEGEGEGEVDGGLPLLTVVDGGCQAGGATGAGEMGRQAGGGGETSWKTRSTGRAIVGYERLPMVELGADKTKRVVYFWTQDCPYPATNYQTLREELLNKRASRAKIQERAYGIPKKVRDAAFPLFSVDVHCLTLAELGRVDGEGVTWYLVMDPANGRNPAMQWWLCDALGREVCVREWPQQDDYIPGVGMPGPWAVLSSKAKKLDGDKGPAQESWGLTYGQMAAEMQRVEEELARTVEGRVKEEGARIEVFRRILDSRLGNTEMHGTTIQKEFAKVGIYFEFASGKHLNVTSAASEATAGITLINDALGYQTDRPLGPLNRPKLYVVYEAPEDGEAVPRGCANTVFALKTWTGADKETGACKDWVDITHYFRRAEPRHVTFPWKEGRRGAVAGQWGGYGS